LRKLRTINREWSGSAARVWSGQLSKSREVPGLVRSGSVAVVRSAAERAPSPQAIAAPAEQTVPRLSVIVPAYNASATLALCLQAIGGSAGTTYEVIVVDDASTDETAAIAASYGARVIRLARQSGAAVARNAGASVANADLLFFTDADVLVRPDVLARVVALFDQQPDVHAVFGSYTAETLHTNFCSVYKNLVHHATHQAANPSASTFWTAAGGIRAEVFHAIGGFDPADTRSADVEDIALGYRLTRAGYRIRLDRELQVTHAKYYNLPALIRSDVLHRAIPWTRLMLRERRYQRDLNTNGSGIFSGLVLLLLAPTVVWSVLAPGAIVVVCALVLAFLFLNRRLLGTFLAHCPRFLIPAVGMTAFYYLYAMAGASIACWMVAIESSRARLRRAFSESASDGRASTG
jgi:glycosyltransferase involved in cell wall biosynthesis